MNKDTKVMSLQSYCRTCLNMSEKCKHYILQFPRDIFQLFKQITGFPKTYNELYPSWICDSCFSKIKNFAEIRSMSRKSIKFFEEMINSYAETFAKNINNDKVDEVLDETPILKSELFQCYQTNSTVNELLESVSLKQHLVASPPIVTIESVSNNKDECNQGGIIKTRTQEKAIKMKTYTFVCETCGQIFKNVTNLREHSFKHLPVEERPYKCEKCSKRFTSKRSYKEHRMRHSGIKNYECKHCGLKKTTRKELKYHLNVHTKEKLYNCSMCAKAFSRASGLKLHERVVHQSIKKYKCNYCEECFGKPDTLKHHVMRHTGERPHKCEICERSFIQLVALKAHIKTHTK